MLTLLKAVLLIIGIASFAVAISMKLDVMKRGRPLTVWKWKGAIEPLVAIGAILIGIGSFTGLKALQ